ncbi:MAG: light-harvesting protein [Pseudomonadota bacterium]
MNNAKLWLVVKPTVGIPLFLGAVAVGSFAVHVAVVTNTSWVADFLSGAEMGSTASASLDVESKVQTAALPSDGDRITVVLPDGTTAKAIIEMPPRLAEVRPRQTLE